MLRRMHGADTDPMIVALNAHGVSSRLGKRPTIADMFDQPRTKSVRVIRSQSEDDELGMIAGLHEAYGV